LKNILDYETVFFDINGVITENSRLIDGAIELINLLKKNHIKVRLLTNCISINTQLLTNKLIDLGLPIKRSEIVSAIDTCQSYLKKHNLKPYCLINKHTASEFTHYSKEEANCILLGDAREKLNYHNLNTAFNLIQQGLVLYAIGDNRYFKSNNNLMLDTGAFVHLLQHTTQKEAIILGKPHVDFFNSAIKKVNSEANHCLMVGDDIFGDIEGALMSGMDAVLVKTGKYQQGDELKLTQRVNTLDSIINFMD